MPKTANITKKEFMVLQAISRAHSSAKGAKGLFLDGDDIPVSGMDTFAVYGTIPRLNDKGFVSINSGVLTITSKGSALLDKVKSNK
jgi:NADPH-dependent 7-cyano-7-deazaguanine reductase QueF-like protein